MISSEGTFKRAINNPLLMILAALFGFLYSYIDNVNPLPEVAMGFFSLGGDLLGTIIGAISVVFTPGILFKGLLLVLIITLLGSFIIGFYMAGYMNLVKAVVVDRKRDSTGFVTGIKENFGSSIKSTFLLIITALLMVIVVVVASVPALSTMWSAFHGDKKILPLALFISLLSFFALFFFVLFYNVYISFWYPAITMGYKKFVKESKRIVDEHFFGIAAKILIYSFEFFAITAISVLIRFMFKEAMQHTGIFFAAVFVEGILLTLWFTGITSYTTYVLAYLTGKNSN